MGKQINPHKRLNKFLHYYFVPEENPLAIMLKKILFCLLLSKYDPNLEKKGEHLTNSRFFMRSHGGHAAVHINGEKILLGILFYYYAKLERHFAIVLYTNIAVLSRDFSFQSFRFVSPLIQSLQGLLSNFSR